jgi:hypothetical protein
MDVSLSRGGVYRTKDGSLSSHPTPKEEKH